jgi:hypothetical protein
VRPVDVVEMQVKAYNARDIEAFVGCYGEDVVIEDGLGRVLMQGRDGMRAEYGPFFEQNPALRGEILQRMEIGDWVVDEERIHGAGPQPISAVAIYRVVGGAIVHVRFLGGRGT